jgi:hypothetical protein
MIFLKSKQINRRKLPKSKEIIPGKLPKSKEIIGRVLPKSKEKTATLHCPAKSSCTAFALHCPTPPLKLCGNKGS